MATSCVKHPSLRLPHGRKHGSDGFVPSHGPCARVIASTCKSMISPQKHHTRTDRHVMRFRENDAPIELTKDLKVDHQLDTPAVAPGQAPTSLPTVFRLGAHCDYGERYGLLGSVEQLGNWDPAKAVPMQWTDGDVWTAAVPLPAGTDVYYKHVRLDKRGGLLGYCSPEGYEADGGEAIKLLPQPGTTCLRGTCAEVLYHLPPQLSVFLHDQQQQEQQGQEQQQEPGNPHGYRSELPCVIRLVHHCEYGEHFGLLGNCEGMGNWEAAKAVPLKWAGNDTWTVAVPLPIGQEVQYKFVLLDDQGCLLRYCDEITPPRHNNLKIFVQSGSFTLHGSSARVLSHLPPHLRKFVAGSPPAEREARRAAVRRLEAEAAMRRAAARRVRSA